MIFIGNGFDISVLKKYGKGITTSYDSFYSFFKYKYHDNYDNLLIKQMEKAKAENKENWSDFEAILDNALSSLSESNREQIKKLSENLSEIQQAFSSFLNDIIDNDVINNISKANDIIVGSKENCAKRILKCSFLKDLTKVQYEAMDFHNRLKNNETLKYVFINFNYTALLDNYLYLNKKIFDPEPYNTSNNNITLDINPNEYEHATFPDPYMQLMPTDIFHPHGTQHVPKSLLFGIENKNYCNKDDHRRIFIKSLWAQCQSKYDDIFNETELFIAYGCSIGKSDNWWWSRIYKRLISENPAELIIYNYCKGNEDENEIKDKFIKNCCLENGEIKTINKAKERIYIVNFDSKVEFMSLPDLGK